jgi:hypothetical protein
MFEIAQISRQPGVYRCVICGAEVFVHAGQRFPQCAGRDHTPRWVLTAKKAAVVVAASTGREAFRNPHLA